jgi:hypothetical protein
MPETVLESLLRASCRGNRGSQSALKWLLITFRKFDMRGPVYVKGLGQRCPI